MTSGRPASSNAGIPLSFASRVLAGALLRLFHDGGKVVCRVGIDVEGGEEASRHPQSIIAANHNSLVDTPVVSMSPAPTAMRHDEPAYSMTTTRPPRETKS